MSVRVRFAPSPTGPLHIGGVRTALYNFLLARQHQGSFVLRIEDTDQGRYVAGAEQYIMDTLDWFGISPDEGPQQGGNYGPYRQSERKDTYLPYIQLLIDSGHAYYAFDTTEELDSARQKDQNFRYDNITRYTLKNSLTLSAEETKSYLASGQNYTVRLKMPKDETIGFEDQIRGKVVFDTNELDDKVILKSDQMPTYHLANVVDDHLMAISHVIRGEEWISSTPHHVYMYRAFGWSEPAFAHLPLILKPNGEGKLSKRDGAKFGFPVFPLSWAGAEPDEKFVGFKEEGFLPEALINFLALLGWSPSGDREKFSLSELCQAFSLDRVGYSGARFDIEKAKRFNQQYILQTENKVLAKLTAPFLEESGYHVQEEYMTAVCELMKPRAFTTKEIITHGKYFFEPPKNFDEANIQKRYKPEHKVYLQKIADLLSIEQTSNIDTIIKDFVDRERLKISEYMPLLRIAICGSMQGPAIVECMEVIGKIQCAQRIQSAIKKFDEIYKNKLDNENIST